MGLRQAQSEASLETCVHICHFQLTPKALPVSHRIVSAGDEKARASLRVWELKNNLSACRGSKLSSGTMRTEGCPFIQPKPEEIAAEVQKKITAKAKPQPRHVTMLQPISADWVCSWKHQRGLRRWPGSAKLLPKFIHRPHLDLPLCAHTRADVRRGARGRSLHRVWQCGGVTASPLI